MKATIKKWLLAALTLCSTFLFAYGASGLTKSLFAKADEIPQASISLVESAQEALELAESEQREEDTTTFPAAMNSYWVHSTSLRYPSNTEGVGIRFKTRVAKTLFDTYMGNSETRQLNAGVSTGTLVLPTSMLGGNALVTGTADVANINTSPVWVQRTDDNGVEYMETCAYIYDIPSDALNTKLTVRSYIAFTDANGVKKIAYTAGLQNVAENTPITLSEIAVIAQKTETDAEKLTTLRESYLKRTLNLYDESWTKVGTQDVYYGEPAEIDEATLLPDKSGSKIVGWTDRSGQYPFTFGTTVVKGNINLRAKYETFTAQYPSEVNGAMAVSPTFTMSTEQGASVDTPYWDFAQIRFDKKVNLYQKDYLAVHVQMPTGSAKLTLGVLNGDRYSTAASGSAGKPVYFWTSGNTPYAQELTISDGAVTLSSASNEGVLLIPMSSLGWQFGTTNNGLKDVSEFFFTTNNYFSYNYSIKIGEIGLYRGAPDCGYEYESLFTAKNGVKPNAYYVDSTNADSFSVPYTNPQRKNTNAYQNAAIWDATALSASAEDQKYQRLWLDLDSPLNVNNVRYFVAEYYVKQGTPNITFGLKSGNTLYSANVNGRNVYGFQEGETQMKKIASVNNGGLTLPSSYNGKRVTLILPTNLFEKNYGEDGSLSSINRLVLETNNKYNYNFEVVLGEVGYVDKNNQYTSIVEPTLNTNKNSPISVSSDIQGTVAKLSYVGNMQTMEETDALFMGDSYMDIWDIDHKNAIVGVDSSVSYGDIIYNSFKEITKKAGLSYAVNLGVGGTQIDHWKNGGTHNDITILSPVEYAKRYSPSKIVFHIGVNDIDDTYQTADGEDGTIKELQALYNTYHELFPHTQLYWVSHIPNTTFANFTNVEAGINGENFNNRYYDVNQGMKLFDTANDWFTYIDVWNAFCKNGDGETKTPRPNMFSVGDGLHLNVHYGYPLWGGIILDAMGYTRDHGGVFGDNLDAGYYYTPGWNVNPTDGNQVVNTGIMEQAVYYRNLAPSGNVYFSVDMKTQETTDAIEMWPKAGVMLISDNFTFFAFFDINDGGIGNLNLVYKYNDNSLYPTDWQWGDLQSPISLGAAFDVRTDFRNIAISKIGTTIYVKAGGTLVSRDFAELGLTADEKMVAGIVEFNRLLEVKNATATNDLHEVIYNTLGKRVVEIQDNAKLTVEYAGLEDFFGLKVVAPGQQVTVTPTYDTTKYYLSKVMLNGNALTAQNGVYSFTMPNEDVTISYEVFNVYDGVILDGNVDAGVYGATATVANYSENRQIEVYGVKRDSGVFLRVLTKANSLVDNVYADENADGINDVWHQNTNFEFFIGGNIQRYVNVRGDNFGVTDYKWITIEPGKSASGKYEFILEIFISKDTLVTDGAWSDTELQFNYAWKTPGEYAHVQGDIIHPHMAMNIDWWAGHYVGGAYYFHNDGTHPLQRTLLLGSSGWVIPEKATAQNATIDGYFGEYDQSFVHAAGDSQKATVIVYGKAASDGLYLGLRIVHHTWSNIDEKDNNQWHLNDNIEFRINDLNTGILFRNGEMKVPASITQAFARPATEGDQNVVYVELFMHTGVLQEYNVTIGMAGQGFGGWQSLFWGTNYLEVTSSGIKQVATESSGVVVDGVFNDAAWTAEAKAKTFTTQANGATIAMMGRNVDFVKTPEFGNPYLVYGVLLGFTITHTKAVDAICQNDGSQWFHYMGPEVRINNNNTTQIAVSYKATIGGNAIWGETVNNGDGTYTTNLEMFMERNTVNDVSLAIGGIYETGFAYLWHSDWWADRYPFTVTANGIVSNLDGVLNERVWNHNTQPPQTTTLSEGYNNASISMVGVKTTGGILLGFTVVHTKAVDAICQEDGSGWWHYMGPEVRVNGDLATQIAASCIANLACEAAYKSTYNETTGKYTTVWEMFIPCATTDSNGNPIDVTLAVGGVFETGFAVLWGSDWSQNKYPFKVTANGIVANS